MKTDIQAIKDAIDYRYLDLDDQEKRGKITGNLPFDTIYPPEDTNGVLYDSELSDFLKRMRKSKPRRQELYTLLEKHLPNKEVEGVLLLILKGFEALYWDHCHTEDGKKAGEYRQQKEMAEKVRREAPLLNVRYQEDLFYGLTPPSHFYANTPILFRTKIP